MDSVLITAIINLLFTVGFGITAILMIDKERRDKEQELGIEKHKNAKLNKLSLDTLEENENLTNRNQALEGLIIQLNDEKAVLENRLYNCNEVYNKVIAMNKQQEEVIADMEKWKRDRDTKTGRFKPKNK